MQGLKVSSNSDGDGSGSCAMNNGKTLSQLNLIRATGVGSITQPQVCSDENNNNNDNSSNSGGSSSSNGNVPDSIGRRLIEKYSSGGVQDISLTTDNVSVSREWKLPDRAKPGPKQSVTIRTLTPEDSREKQISNISRLGNSTNTTVVPVTSFSTPGTLSPLTTNTLVKQPPGLSVSSMLDTPGERSFVLRARDYCSPSPPPPQSTTTNNTTSVSPLSIMVSTTPTLPETDGQLKERHRVSRGLTEGSVDSVARRRKQNRDAQRAYRERKANRIQVLESTVESLQSLVEDWKTKYRALCEELDATKLKLNELSTENEALKAQIESQRTLDRKHPVGHEIELPSHTNATSSHLNYLIENMKPMKAVPLKKRRMDPELGSSYEQGLTKLVNSQSTATATVTATTNSNSNSNSNGLPDFPVYHSSSTTSSSGSATSPFSLLPVPNVSSVASSLPSLDSWKPGSCTHCQADPGNRAFCRSIFERNNKDTPLVFPREFSQRKNLVASLPTPSSSTKLDVQNTLDGLASVNPKSTCHCGNSEETKEYIPISDAYQRIKKHMAMSRIANSNPLPTGDSHSTGTSGTGGDPALARILENVATNAEVRGRKIEVGSVKRIMDNINSHATN